MNVEEITKRAIKYAKRREYLGRHAIRCPNCGTEQVQLIDHLVKPAEWKCRHCKTKYTFEPDIA